MGQDDPVPDKPAKPEHKTRAAKAKTAQVDRGEWLTEKPQVVEQLVPAPDKPVKPLVVGQDDPVPDKPAKPEHKTRAARAANANGGLGLAIG